MFEKGREEMLKGGATETIVGASVKLKGNLRSDGNILIEGTVAGDLKTKGAVVVGETASVVANIKAENVSVSGAVQGNIEVSDRLEITGTGTVLGDISASVLTIAPGATFSGRSLMPDHPRSEKPRADVEPEESEISE